MFNVFEVQRLWRTISLLINTTNVPSVRVSCFTGLFILSVLPSVGCTSPLRNYRAILDISFTGSGDDADPTTLAPTITSTTPAPVAQPKVEVEFKLEKEFTQELANTSSPEFKNLATTISTAMDSIYSAKFGSGFNRTKVTGMRQGSVIVDVELVFNSVDSVPESQNVADTLIEAASSNTSDFSALGLNTSSIKAEQVFTVPVVAVPATTPAAITTAEPATQAVIKTTAAPVSPGASTVKMEVVCLEDSIQVVLEESGKIQLNKDNLRLSDPNCTLLSNGTHLLANMSLIGCGTQMEDDGKYLIFRNMILSNDDPRAIVTRDAEVDIEFFCKYSKRGDVVLSYIAHRPPVTFTEKGFGTFTYQFEFFQSQAFTQQKDPNSYPLEFDVGDMMYMQIESISSVPNTELFAESCRATPSDNPHDTISYPIILHGCKADETVQIYANGDQSKVQFAMKAFKFMGHHDQVYITCSVILCEAGMTNSRCSQGCSRSIQITKREASFQSATNHTSGHQIHKRDVPSEATGYFLSHSHHKINEREASYQTSGHFISQGPVRLRHQIDSPVAEGMNKNLITGVSCLLAAIAMVCGVVVYRTPRSPNTGMV